MVPIISFLNPIYLPEKQLLFSLRHVNTGNNLAYS